MHLMRVLSAQRSRAFLLTLPASSSRVLDRAARLARLAGGLAFTGSARHFVRYRDERSPYGYDVVDLAAAPAGAEFVLHGEGGPQGYGRESELGVGALILRLSPRRVPGSERLGDEARALVYLTVARGLGEGVIRYLWRNRVRAEVALVTPRTTSAFAAPGEAGGFLLARMHDVPARVLGCLVGVPGVTAFRPVLDQVVMQVGYAHPVELSACASLFGSGFYLFRAEHDRVDVLPGPVEFAATDRLTEIRLPEAEPPAGAPLATSAPAGILVPLRIVPTLEPPRRVAGALIAGADLERLKKLVYALPPALLTGHRAVLSDHGLLVLCADGGSPLPLGSLLSELAPGVLLPLGTDLAPRISADLLASALGVSAGGDLVVFPRQGPPFSVPAASLAPLDRQLVAALPVAAAPVTVPTVAAEATSVVNDPLGMFALWGFRGPAREA